MELKIGTIKKCDVCGSTNVEGVSLKVKLFKIIPINVSICQKCISKTFKQFKKGK